MGRPDAAWRRASTRLRALVMAFWLSGCVPSHEMSSSLSPGRDCPGERKAGDAPIAWYFPEASADDGKLEAWCMTVGPPVGLANPSADFGLLGADDSLTVASWNVNVGGGDLMAFVRDELDLRCSESASALAPGASHFALLIQEALRRSSDIPAAAAQWAIPPPVSEAARAGPRLDVVEVAERCGLSFVYVAAARNGSELRDGEREDKGVAILSTLALADFIAIELPYEAARRVAVAATLHASGRDGLRVVSVHLISTPPPSRVLTTGNASRLRQALAVAGALRQAELARGATISTILAGDLNTWSNRQTTLRHLREHFPDSPPPPEEGTPGPFPTDHLLFRRADGSAGPAIIQGSYRRIENSYKSDHHPLQARVRFQGY